MNGSAQERKLMRALVELGWHGVRGPSSGSAPREQPDVLAAKQGTVLVSELKSGKRPSNLAPHEVEAIEILAEAFDGAAVVAVRYTGDRTFYFARPGDLDRTDSDNYSIPGAPERLHWFGAVEFGNEVAFRAPGNADPVFSLEERVANTAHEQLPPQDGWNDPR